LLEVNFVQDGAASRPAGMALGRPARRRQAAGDLRDGTHGGSHVGARGRRHPGG
jgi:hypothetical protein